MVHTVGPHTSTLAGSAVLDSVPPAHTELPGHGAHAPVLGGLTGDQRVFLGWAQVWREKIREETLRQRLVTDPHSPAVARVNGTIRNVAGWYAAFGIQPGDKLYVAPDQRVKIW